MKCSTSALKSVSRWKEKPMGAALSFLGQKLFASLTLFPLLPSRSLPQLQPLAVAG